MDTITQVSDFFYYVQGNTQNEWKSAQRWQRQFFDSLQNDVNVIANGKNIYYGFKVNTCSPINELDRPNIAEEIGAVEFTVTKPTGIWSYVFSRQVFTKTLKYHFGVICNLLTKTSRIYIGVPPDVDRGLFISLINHNGPLKITDEALDKFSRYYSSKISQIPKKSPVNPASQVSPTPPPSPKINIFTIPPNVNPELSSDNTKTDEVIQTDQVFYIDDDKTDIVTTSIHDDFEDDLSIVVPSAESIFPSNQEDSEMIDKIYYQDSSLPGNVSIGTSMGEVKNYHLPQYSLGTQSVPALSQMMAPRYGMY